MAFKQADSINFDKLEKELQSAVDADAKYWRENDAKFRAIEQKVATYDDFKYEQILYRFVNILPSPDKRSSTCPHYLQQWSCPCF